MNRIVNFVREKAFVLILLGSILAAAGTGLWAINTVQQNLNQTTLPDESALDDFAGFGDAQQEGDSIWDEPADTVTDEMNGEIAMQAQPEEQEPSEEAVVLEPGNPSDGADGQNAPTDSSSDLSGSSSLSEPSEASAVLEPQAAAGTVSFVLPVSGAILQEYSAQELVYSETLCDWRTHNGVDYAASLGEEVIAPVAGQVVRVYTDGNWGGVVELLDQNGYTWRFCGVENSTLQAGDAVSISQVIGCIGTISAESALQTHLHLEILHEGVYQDPSEFLR
ncbi:MAG: M23 family metallopeptidase [Faecalibacterium sp.]